MSDIKYGDKFEFVDMHGEKRVYVCADESWVPSGARKVEDERIKHV